MPYHKERAKTVFFIVIAPEFNPYRPGDSHWTPGRAQIVSTNDKNVGHKSPFVESVEFKNGRPHVNLAGKKIAEGWRLLTDFYKDEGDSTVALARLDEFLRRTIEDEWAGVKRFSLSMFLDKYGPAKVRELRAKKGVPSDIDPFAEADEQRAESLLNDDDPPPRDHALPPTTEATELAHKIATASTQRAAAETAGMAWGKLVKHARDLGLDAHALLGTKANED